MPCCQRTDPESGASQGNHSQICSRRGDFASLSSVRSCRNASWCRPELAEGPRTLPPCCNVPVEHGCHPPYLVIPEPQAKDRGPRLLLKSRKLPACPYPTTPCACQFDRRGEILALPTTTDRSGSEPRNSSSFHKRLGRRRSLDSARNDTLERRQDAYRQGAPAPRTRFFLRQNYASEWTVSSIHHGRRTRSFDFAQDDTCGGRRTRGRRAAENTI